MFWIHWELDNAQSVDECSLSWSSTCPGFPVDIKANESLKLNMLNLDIQIFQNMKHNILISHKNRNGDK